MKKLTMTSFSEGGGQLDKKNLSTQGFPDESLCHYDNLNSFQGLVVSASEPAPTPSLPHERGRKAAFTLAEVLITLGIIGVVAALTLPTLIQNYQEKATVTKVKKFYSIFSQAYMRAVADNGTMDNWGLTDSAYDKDEEGNNTEITEETIVNLDKFFKIIEPYLIKGGYEKIHPSSYGNENKGYQLADGTSIVALYLSPSTCSQSSKGMCGDIYLKTDNKPYLDSNNKKRPNIFNFTLYKDHIKPTGIQNEKFSQCLSGEDYSRCTAWVIQNENMDYLHCNDLSWDGKRKCK